MMNDPADHERLLSALFAEPDANRAASLAQGLMQLRRGRRLRKVRAICGTSALVLAAAWFVTGRRDPVTIPAPPLAPALAQPASTVKILTDDELLDQFPGRAVALVGPAEHRRLVFFDVNNPANREVR
jgi:hypothetical protein